MALGGKLLLRQIELITPFLDFFANDVGGFSFSGHVHECELDNRRVVGFICYAIVAKYIARKLNQNCMNFIKRIGPDPHENGAQTVGCRGCPDIWELEGGDFAVIGIDITDVPFPFGGAAGMAANGQAYALIYSWFHDGGTKDNKTWDPNGYDVGTMKFGRGDQYTNYRVGYACGYAFMETGDVTFLEALWTGATFYHIVDWKPGNDNFSMVYNGMIDGILDSLDKSADQY